MYQNTYFTANDLEIYQDLIICGTKRHGLLFFEKDQFVGEITEEDGLHSSFIKKLKVLDHYLIILSNYDFQIFDLKSRTFLSTGPANGIYPKAVIDFDISKDKIWILESNSFYKIDVTDLEKEEEIGKLYLDDILVNGSPINYNIRNTLSFDENNLAVHFDYRDLSSQSETRLLYILEGFDKTWHYIPIEEAEIYYQYLPPGKYTLRMKAKYGNKESPEFSYPFSIDTPYWKKWWFYLFMIFSVFALATLLFRIRLRIQTRNIQAKNELDNSKLAAIRSQMNPHFIFNALNSIQHLVIKGDVENSYSYLNKFAKLVRKTLDYSEIEAISIAEEISLIEVYLSLEKLRFVDQFEYTITPPEKTTDLIPGMLIQPFIENAIVHGLLHKNGPKKLTITFELREYLLCIIEDNGIGREKSKEIKLRQTGSHKSFSMDAIFRRFEILNEYYDSQLGFEFEDIQNEDHEETGTKVILRIPLHANR